MWVAVEVLRAEADRLEEVLHPLLAALHAVDLERRPDDLTDRLARVQRRVRILEDHLHLAPQRPQLALRDRRDVAAVEADRAACWIEEPQDQPCCRRLPAAGFAHDAQGLAATDVERDVLDCVHLCLPAGEDTLLHREAFGQMLDLDEVVAGVGPIRAHARAYAGGASVSPTAHAASPRRAIERLPPSRCLSSHAR